MIEDLAPGGHVGVGTDWIRPVEQQISGEDYIVLRYADDEVRGTVPRMCFEDRCETAKIDAHRKIRRGKGFARVGKGRGLDGAVHPLYRREILLPSRPDLRIGARRNPFLERCEERR